MFSPTRFREQHSFQDHFIILIPRYRDPNWKLIFVDCPVLITSSKWWTTPSNNMWDKRNITHPISWAMLTQEFAKHDVSILLGGNKYELDCSQAEWKCIPQQSIWRVVGVLCITEENNLAAHSILANAELKFHRKEILLAHQ